FFFQAEDGIRDFHVTGVQTCALPIFISFKNSGGKPRVKLILLKSYSVLNNVDKRSLKEEINCSKSAMLVDCFKLLSISIFIVFKCFTFDNVAGHSMKNTLKRL